MVKLLKIELIKNRGLRAKKTIVKLQRLDPHSLEYYDVATKFFRIRSRSIRSCGLMFFFFALIGLMGIFAPWGTWFGHTLGVFVFSFSAFYGWVAFRIGHTQIVLIKASRLADQKYRENALRMLCNREYCKEPIGVFILRQLGDSSAQATLNPGVKKNLKRKRMLIRRLFGKCYTDEEHEKWVEGKEKILREKVNQQLKLMTATNDEREPFEK